MIKRISITLLCLFVAASVVYCLLGLFAEYSSDKSRYEVLRDHGSLIAGLIGFAGVVLLVLNQNRETRKVLDSNIAMVKNEAFEAKRSKAIEVVTKFSYRLNLLMAENKQSFRFWHTDIPGKHFFGDIKSELYFLDVFLSIYDKDEGSMQYQDCIRSFLNVYEDHKWKDITEFTNSRDLFAGLLSIMVVLDENAEIKKRTAANFYINPHDEDAPIDGPNYVYKNFDQLTEHEVCRFVIQYMQYVLMPTLINTINNIER